jgi:hypothetical protein
MRRAENVQFWLMLQVAHLIVADEHVWPPDRGFVYCGLG